MRCASIFMYFPDILPDIISNAIIDIGLPTTVPDQKAFTYGKDDKQVFCRRGKFSGIN